MGSLHSPQVRDLLLCACAHCWASNYRLKNNNNNNKKLQHSIATWPNSWITKPSVINFCIRSWQIRLRQSFDGLCIETFQKVVQRKWNNLLSSSYLRWVVIQKVASCSPATRQNEAFASWALLRACMAVAKSWRAGWYVLPACPMLYKVVYHPQVQWRMLSCFQCWRTTQQSSQALNVELGATMRGCPPPKVLNQRSWIGFL